MKSILLVPPQNGWTATDSATLKLKLAEVPVALTTSRVAQEAAGKDAVLIVTNDVHERDLYIAMGDVANPTAPLAYTEYSLDGIASMIKSLATGVRDEESA